MPDFVKKARLADRTHRGGAARRVKWHGNDTGKGGGNLRYIDRITGKLITTQAEFDALRDDPVSLPVVDPVGSRNLRYLGEVYLEAWAGNSPHEEYAGLLPKIRSEAIARSREQWQPRKNTPAGWSGSTSGDASREG